MLPRPRSGVGSLVDVLQGAVPHGFVQRRRAGCRLRTAGGCGGGASLGGGAEDAGGGVGAPVVLVCLGVDHIIRHRGGSHRLVLVLIVRRRVHSPLPAPSQKWTSIAACCFGDAADLSHSIQTNKKKPPIGAKMPPSASKSQPYETSPPAHVPAPVPRVSGVCVSR